LLLLIAFNVCAQRYLWSPDSVSLADPNYAMDRYRDLLRYHQPIMYLAYPFVEPVAHRKVAFIDGEGKNGYWLEGQFSYRFVIYQGKYYSHRFFQRIRPTLDISLLSRLTRDDSAPLLPMNNKFGFGLDYLLSGLDQLKNENANLLWATLQLHHYSNGQADSFFIDNPVQRNNYIGGDFSTNYYRILLNFTNTGQQKHLITTSVGYERELPLWGQLSRSTELKNYYGDRRVLAQFQLIKKPKLVTVDYKNRATRESDTVRIEKRRQLGFRTEVDYIIGDLSKFAGSNKWRTGWHSYLTYMPSTTNEVGFVVHTYLGRDYLNVRFDDVVFIAELGIYVKFNGK